VLIMQAGPSRYALASTELEDGMLPFYPLNQDPAGHDDERMLRPAIRMQMLDHERKQYGSMQRQTEGGAHKPVMAATHVFHRSITLLLAIIGHKGPRPVLTSPIQRGATAEGLCIPGVDC
jgi:hypothetical protein